MGSSSSSSGSSGGGSRPAEEGIGGGLGSTADVPDFYYKGKPYPNELPAWFKSIRLVDAELLHLRPVPNPKTNKSELRFSNNELSQAKLNGELARQITLDCTKRCTYSYKGEVDEFGMVPENAKHIAEPLSSGSEGE